MSAALVSVFFVMVRACFTDIHTRAHARTTPPRACILVLECAFFSIFFVVVVMSAFFFLVECAFFSIFFFICSECDAGERILFVLVLVFCFVLLLVRTCRWCVYECCAGDRIFLCRRVHADTTTTMRKAHTGAGVCIFFCVGTFCSGV